MQREREKRAQNKFQAVGQALTSQPGIAGLDFRRLAHDSDFGLAALARRSSSEMRIDSELLAWFAGMKL